MQTSSSIAPKYDGPIQNLLSFCNAVELSQITHEQLVLFAENATVLQRAQLFRLWTGQQDVGAELRQVLHDITWPKERARLLGFLGGIGLPQSDLEAVLEVMAWR
jgi:hypothetical protein